MDFKRSTRTVADLMTQRGREQLSMLRVTSLAEAEAANHAGIEMVSVPRRAACKKMIRLAIMVGQSSTEFSLFDMRVPSISACAVHGVEVKVASFPRRQ